MKKLSVTALAVLFALGISFGYEAPPVVVNAMANETWGGLREPALRRDELKSHFLTNWRQIAANIEALPTSKFDQKYNKDRVLPSISLFIHDCEGLDPLEYLDFLDQMLVLYEQKRISNTAFEHALGPDLEKKDFLSVNYEHPRVAAFLKKAMELTPPEDEAMLSALQKTARGALADNYMTDRGDDDPLPETLPGVRLKRPWGSIIRKYERITGKKVPPDPDFPDEDHVRPDKRPGSTLAGADGVHADSSASGIIGRPLVWAGILLLAVLGLLAWLKKKKRAGNNPYQP